VYEEEGEIAFLLNGGNFEGGGEVGRKEGGERE
jgi:hypothetical protein